MIWYHWLAIVSFAGCLAFCMIHLVMLVRLGNSADHAKPSGSISSGVAYAFTAAMNPRRKESAYLHLPTYAAGLAFHMGTFLSLALFLPMIWLAGDLQQWPLIWILSGLLLVSGGCGLGILIKRIFSPILRGLSNPDDYISNLLVTLFQISLAICLVMPAAGWFFFLMATLLFLWLPLGKLRHAVYFFAARYHLGRFYGSRGVWPERN